MANRFTAAAAKACVDAYLATLTAPKFVLLKDSITPDPDTHATYADISAHECDASGYTAKGKAVTLASETDTPNSRIEVDVTNGPLVWSSLGSGNTLQHGAIIDDDGGSVPVIALFSRGTSIPTNGEDFTVTFDTADGNMRFSY